MDNAKGHAKDFMLRQARPKDVEFFVGLAKMGPTKVEDLPMSVVVPGFILSELRTGFQMGFKVTLIQTMVTMTNTFQTYLVGVIRLTVLLESLQRFWN